MSRHYKQAHVWFHPWWHVVFLIHQNLSLAAICASNVLFSACVCRCSEWPEFFARTLYFLVAEKQRLRQSMLIQCLCENANIQVCHLEMAQWHDEACKRIPLFKCYAQNPTCFFCQVPLPVDGRCLALVSHHKVQTIQCPTKNLGWVSSHFLFSSIVLSGPIGQEQVHRLLDILEQPSTGGFKRGSIL